MSSADAASPIAPHRRRRAFAAYALVLVTMLAGTSPMLTGDGYEYVGLTVHMAGFHHPAMTAEQAASVEYTLATARPAFEDFDLVANKRSDAHGRFDQAHFWFYSLAAVPAYWVTDTLGLHPNDSFALLNLALLLFGFWVATSRLDLASTALLFAGPVIWYLNKAHTETFVFVLLSLALLWVSEKPWWAFVFLGAAATQVSPIAGLVPAAVLFAALADHQLLRERRFWAGAAVGMTLAVLPPLYYWVRYGVFQIIVEELRVPNLAELSAVLFDPTIGMLGNNPVFLGIVAWAVWLVVSRRTFPWGAADVWLSIAGLALLLPAFAQTNNFNHGAKVGLTRYALWLMPLAIPWMSRAATAAPLRWRAAVVPLAVITCAWSLFAFNPNRVEEFGPTRLSAWLWSRHPGWNNPVPEIFTENTARQETAPYPAMTGSCSKLLLINGRWPTPCPPVQVPERCLGREAICYANRVEDGYEFADGGRAFGFPRRPADRLWPRSADGEFNAWLAPRWWDARVFQSAGGESMVRAVDGVERLRIYQNDASLLVYLHGAAPGALVRLRVPWESSGSFMNPDGGRVIEAVGSGPVLSGELWELAIPGEGGDVVLALSRQ